jgi:hypothetical protein
MAIYEKTAKEIAVDWIKQNLRADQALSAGDLVAWFATHRPQISERTVRKTL